VAQHRPGVHGINFASRPDGWTPEGQAPLYANKRAEMWGRGKRCFGATLQ
jgi:hypothetical protein